MSKRKTININKEIKETVIETEIKKKKKKKLTSMKKKIKEVKQYQRWQHKNKRRFSKL